LISDDAGTPTAYGQGVHDHLVALAGATATPTTTPNFKTTPTNTPVSGTLSVQIENNGLDNTQESDYGVDVINNGSSAATGVSWRLYFTAAYGITPTNYVIDHYNDYLNGSSVAAPTITGPTLAFQSTYYYTFTFGGTSIPAGGTWQSTGRIRLSDWSLNNVTSLDWFHKIFPTTFTTTIYVPAYLSGTIAWGLEPGANNGPTPTVTPFRTSGATSTPGTPTAIIVLLRTSIPGIL
jgi:hypothetical protein